MRRRRLYRIVQFDVRQLGAADDAFLGLRGQCVPAVHIVQVFLHDNVAAASKCRILLAYDCSLGHRCPAWILRAINKPKEVAVIEVTKSMNLVDR